MYKQHLFKKSQQYKWLYFLKVLVVPAEDSVILRTGVIGPNPLLLFSVHANKSKAICRQSPTAPPTAATFQRCTVSTEQPSQPHTC